MVLANLARQQAFRLRYPAIVQPKRARILHSKQKSHAEFEAISSATSAMPPKSYLCTWKKEQFQKIRSDELGYVDCNLKKEARYDIQAINQLPEVHKDLELSEEVKRELDLYAEMVDWPSDVETRPRQQRIRQFQHFLYSSRFDELLPDYHMSAEELSQICCTRWLSSDHMGWMTQELNKI